MVVFKEEIRHLLIDIPLEVKDIRDINHFFQPLDRQFDMWIQKNFIYLFTVQVVYCVIACYTAYNSDIRAAGMAKFDEYYQRVVEKYPGTDAESLANVRKELDKTLWHEVRAAMIAKGEAQKSSYHRGFSNELNGSTAGKTTSSQKGTTPPKAPGVSNQVSAHSVQVTSTSTNVPSGLKYHSIRQFLEATVQSIYPPGTTVPRSKNVWTRSQVKINGNLITDERPFVSLPAACAECYGTGTTPHVPKCIKDQCNTCEKFGHLKRTCLTPK